MAQLKNVAGLTTDELNRELQSGGRFVLFQYCISVLIMTFRRGSAIYFIRAGESTAKYSWQYTLLTLLLGWWGIPWGPIYSIGSLHTNLTGGKDVTQQVLASLNAK